MIKMRPRCGAEMIPYEKVWGALLEPPTCGRPEGHVGRHRSVQSIRKEQARQRIHWAEYSRKRRQKERELRLRNELIAAVESAARHAKDMELRTRQVNW